MLAVICVFELNVTNLIEANQIAQRSHLQLNNPTSKSLDQHTTTDKYSNFGELL